MRRHGPKKKQPGVALLLAVFALLLLSAIGLAMLYSADTETVISSNYRDKQVATYAAVSALHEARDRLSPSGDIAPPTGLPNTGAANVLYVINPAAGETVAPWLHTNAHADSELCHQRTLGLAVGAASVPCTGSTSLPSGSSWYAAINNSLSSYTGPFKLAFPLAYKWLRINLKANNSGLYAVNGNPAEAAQVCWDGRNQIPVPAGYSAACAPGTIGSLTLSNGGSDYTSNPAVTISGGGGSGATATATIGSSQVTAVAVTSGGSGYTSAPVVSLAPPASGTTAAATAQVSGSVVSITIANDGSKYTPGTYPLVLSGGGGSGAAGTATVGAGKNVTSVSLTSGGSGYSSPPSISFNAPQGNGGKEAVLVANILGQVVAVTVTNGGSGYTAAPAVSFSGGGGASATATASVTPAAVVGLMLTNGGSGYSSAPTVTISGGGGSGATATAQLAGGTYYGAVMMLTSLAVTATGARSMAQMEAAPSVRGIALPGALTLAGPTPTFGAPNSTNFFISGNDLNTCGGTAQPARVSTGAYDHPQNPTTPSAVDVVKAAIPSGLAGHYVGIGPVPDVENVYGSLGEQMGSPAGLQSVITAVANVATNSYSGSVSSIASGTPTDPVVVFVDGDLSIGGNFEGFGILLVTGTLALSGDFSWSGVVLVIGEGVAQMNGGGNGQITGSIFIAKIHDSSGNLLPTLGAPVLDWSGGGGNGVYWDHCWVNSVLARVPFTPPANTQPLNVLSVRTINY